jgi:ATP-dependent Clp protease adaptor protein ClpS
LRPQWVRSETLMDSVIIGVTTAPQRQAGRQQQLQRKPYPHFKVVVLDDDVNTFVHVVDCLVRYVPAMTPDQAWELAHQIDGQGAAVVWSGPQEQAELIHQQLGGQGLTMAPLEPA